MKASKVISITFEGEGLSDKAWEAFDRFVADLHDLGVRVKEYDYWPYAWEEEGVA